MAQCRKTTVLITGCSPGGIGHSLALEFHNRGCHVIATARNPLVLESLRKAGLSTLPLDVTNKTNVNSCAAAVAELTCGKLDILINNAGRTYAIPALDMEFDEVKCTFEANVYGPMLICQAFTKLLIPTRGLIVNISSASTIVPYLWGAIYSASKGAINVYSRALRMELKPLGVRVMVAMTGNVKSNLASHSRPVLPSDSLYRPVQDMFEERLTFSQTQRSVPADHYATQLASAALKDGAWFGGLFGGTPDYFYGGGMIQQARISTWVPQWIADRVIARFFKAHLIAKRIREATKIN